MLVYGREAKLPIFLEFPSVELSHQFELLEDDAMIFNMAKLMELEEKRHQAMHTLDDHQQLVKRSFDKKVIARVFFEGDLVLKLDVDRDKLGRHSKF